MFAGLAGWVKLRLPAVRHSLPVPLLVSSSAPFWARLLIANLLAVICRAIPAVEEKEPTATTQQNASL